MSQLKLTADSGGGTVAIKGPASTAGNAAIELTVPGTGSGTLVVGDTGKILQVIQTVKTDVFSSSSTVAIGGFSADAITASITQSKASNKILIQVNLVVCCQANVETKFAIYKAGSVITAATGDADSYRTRVTSMGSSITASGEVQNLSGQFLDTAGGTSAITYSVRLAHGATTAKLVYLNRSHTDADVNTESRSVSTITLMEVAA